MHNDIKTIENKCGYFLCHVARKICYNIVLNIDN